MRPNHRRLICLSAAGLFAACGANFEGAAVPDSDLAAKIAPAVTGLMRQYGIPGASVAVAYQGRLVYQSGFGMSNVAAGIAVSPLTSFRIASVSKAITAVTVLKLFQDSLPAALDYKVFGPAGLLPDAAFPEFTQPLDARVADITLRDLLQHTSGWQIDGYDPQFDLVNVAREMGVPPPASARTAAAYMVTKRRLGAAPGTQVMYSNFGYNLLGRIIEHKTGKPYAEAVMETVLRPARAAGMFIPAGSGMERMPGETVYYDYPEAPLAANVDGSGKDVPASYGGFDFGTMDAHGGWAATPTDLVRFALAINGTAETPALLSPQTVKLISESSQRLPGSRYGLAFDMASKDGVNIMERPGALVSGTYAIVQMRDDGWTWALTTNRMPISDPANPSMEGIVPDLTRIRDVMSDAIAAVASSAKAGAR